MDIDLLKTFVEVYHTRHFARAADNLFVTPSAVSARIRLLEGQLGTTLFLRERNNIQLTGAGEQFLSHARNILRLWEQARYDVAVETAVQPSLTILSVPGLWDGVQLDWLSHLNALHPSLCLRIETLGSAQIATRLQQNSADLGFMLEPTVGPELQLHELGELHLIMVSTMPDQSPEEATSHHYAMIDWNTSFHNQHANAFPNAPTPKLWVSTGRIAYDLLKTTGGTAYLPFPMVEAALEEGWLHKVYKAPRIDLRTYAAYPIWSERKALIEQVLNTVKKSFPAD